jgi:hypothetical protein
MTFFNSLLHTTSENVQSLAKEVADTIIPPQRPEGSNSIVSILKPLVRDPEKDSVLQKLLAYVGDKATGGEHAEHFAQKVLLPQVISSLINDELDPTAYFLSRLVASHPSAIDFSSEFRSYSLTHSLDEQSRFAILGDCYGVSMEKRSDIPKAIKKLVAYHPQVLPLITKVSSVLTG